MLATRLHMPNTTFDKPAYINALEKSGISIDQAKAHAFALDEAMQDTLVTKYDLLTELAPIKTDIAVMKWMLPLLWWLLLCHF